MLLHPFASLLQSVDDHLLLHPSANGCLATKYVLTDSAVKVVAVASPCPYFLQTLACPVRMVCHKMLAQFGSTRIQLNQFYIAEWITNLLRIKAEIISKHFRLVARDSLK